MILPHITIYDFVVIIGFMLLLVITGIVFRNFSSDSANFFVGGHNMPWWIAGISAFMFGISCATLTCSAGLVHDHG
jgi:Na+/proline symporter